MRAKICGLNSWEDVATALDSGADALGFLVGTTHLAEDKVSAKTARELIKKCPCFVSKVVVTHLQKADDIIPLVQFIGADTIQLHNEIAIEEIRIIHDQLPWIKLIKAVSVQGPEAIEKSLAYEHEVDAIILDSRTADRLGGTGRTHDWNISREIVQQIHLPVVLAGGLTPSNVEKAMATVQPYAIDVNSGVETDGRKDPFKVKIFIKAAHDFEK